MQKRSERLRTKLNAANVNANGDKSIKEELLKIEQLLHRQLIFYDESL